MSNELENEKKVKVDSTTGIIYEEKEKVLDNSIIDDGSTKKRKNKSRGFFYEWGLPIIIAFLLAIGINKFIMFKVMIPSESMVPTLNVKDRLFVTRVYDLDKIKRGDILVFESQELNDTLIKRVIGLPGDRVVVDKGQVYVNDEKIEENYLGSNDSFSGIFDVPEGKYLFFGDNRALSRDARRWDNPYIDGEDIVAKAQIKVYPFDEIGLVK